MLVVTYVTKRSLRKTDSRKQLAYTSSLFEPGDIFECIDGGRKSIAVVIDCQPLTQYKQSARSGAVNIEKLNLSKTGVFSDGHIIDTLDIQEFRECLNGRKEFKTSNKLLKNFIPKKQKKREKVSLGGSGQDKAKKNKKYDLGSLELPDLLKGKNSYPTEMHEMVDIIRKYFGETARFGEGSFSYYLGFFKKIPKHIIYQYFAEVKQTKKNNFDKKKLFWWKIGQYFKKASEPGDKESK